MSGFRRQNHWQRKIRGFGTVSQFWWLSMSEIPFTAKFTWFWENVTKESNLARIETLQVWKIELQSVFKVEADRETSLSFTKEPSYLTLSLWLPVRIALFGAVFNEKIKIQVPFPFSDLLRLSLVDQSTLFIMRWSKKGLDIGQR